jgi:hypothetical protein
MTTPTSPAFRRHLEYLRNRPKRAENIMRRASLGLTQDAIEQNDTFFDFIGLAEEGEFEPLAYFVRDFPLSDVDRYHLSEFLFSLSKSKGRPRGHGDPAVEAQHAAARAVAQGLRDWRRENSRQRGVPLAIIDALIAEAKEAAATGFQVDPRKVTDKNIRRLLQHH